MSRCASPLYTRSCGANFTTQLEKARESTDTADIRDYYAEIATAMVTGDLSVDGDTCVVGGDLSTSFSDNGTGSSRTVKVTVSGWEAHQKESGWQGTTPTIAGVDVSSVDFKGATTIVYTFKPDDDGDLYLSDIGTGSGG